MLSRTCPLRLSGIGSGRVQTRSPTTAFSPPTPKARGVLVYAEAVEGAVSRQRDAEIFGAYVRLGGTLGSVEPTLAPRATSALITTARNAHDFRPRLLPAIRGWRDEAHAC